EGGQTVCYAFTRAKTSSPALPGRGEVVLTVTQRSNVRDAVALSTGFEYAANAAVEVEVDKTKIEFYTAKRSAFARAGPTPAHPTPPAPHPHKNPLTDTSRPPGYTRPYDPITKPCPK